MARVARVARFLLWCVCRMAEAVAEAKGNATYITYYIVYSSLYTLTLYTSTLGSKGIVEK
jgi:hypothetical protein